MVSSALNVIPERLRAAVAAAADERTEEIRIRANRRVMLIDIEPRRIDIIPTPEDCRRMLELVCGHSVFACGEELKKCYVTLGDGSRVGLCGVMYPEGMVMPYSFNIRIAREIHGAADGFMEQIYEENEVKSALLISAPGIGKTTVLRDCARQLSQKGYRVCIADERGEITAPAEGMPTMDVGDADAMWGCGKAEAMIHMIRGMSPEVMITDEMASGEDAEAVLDASGCGIKVIASAHGSGAQDVARRPAVVAAVKGGAFERILVLEKGAHGRTIRNITEELI